MTATDNLSPQQFGQQQVLAASKSRFLDRLGAQRSAPDDVPAVTIPSWDRAGQYDGADQ